MTRRRAFELWHHDQGALNVIFDKCAVRKRFLKKPLWNQVGLSRKTAEDGEVEREGNLLRLKPTGERIYAWHGVGPHRLWHCIGIDHHPRAAEERDRIAEECAGRVPGPICEQFKRCLFLPDFNHPLRQEGHQLKLGA